ncbi:lipase [Gordonibacter sp. An230]|nr:lipase [Gordonibacter sp. An230]
MIVGLFAIQMRYVAASMNLVSIPQASAATSQPATYACATSTSRSVDVEYCSEAAAMRDPDNPAGLTSTRLALDDAWFSEDAGSYNHGIATACAVLSAVCNSESRFYSSDGAEAPYAERALTALGFQHVRTESYALRSTVIDQVAALMNGTNDMSAYTFAAKSLPNGDTLAFVGVRGSYGTEWLSNFSIFEASGLPDHEGYRAAEREVADALAVYLREIGADPSRTRVLTTGHSRGGAIANLLAAELADRANGPNALAREDGVYAYTFAAPGATRSKACDASAYRGIFNIVNPSDIVPQLPLSSWGYARYGTTIELPSVGDPCFETELPAMQQAYERNTGQTNQCNLDALGSLAAFDSKIANLLPTPDSLLSPTGAFSALQQLVAVDANSAFLSHCPDTYIAWMQAIDEDALSFA